MENPKTGELMSKSKGTGVFLDAKPNEMFGQIMAQPDEMIEILFVNNTSLSLEEIKQIISGNPRNAKARLALEIVKLFYGEKQAQKAGEEFDRIHKAGELPSNIPTFETDKKEYFMLDLLCDTKLAPSKNEAKRLVEAGAVDIGGLTEKDWKKPVQIVDGTIIRAGNRKFVKIKIKY